MTKFNEHINNFSITKDNDGQYAASKLVNVAVLDDVEAKLFQRRAIKNALSETPEFDTMLVVRADEFNVYVKGNNIVITKKDMLI